MVNPVTPRTHQPEKKASLGCLGRAALAFTGLVVMGGTAAMCTLCTGAFDASAVKREAVATSNRVLECTLAGDRQCARRESTWDDRTLESSMRAAHWIDGRLGKRGQWKVRDDAWRWNHSFGTGPSWRIELQFVTDYEHAKGAVESFSL